MEEHLAFGSGRVTGIARRDVRPTEATIAVAPAASASDRPLRQPKDWAFIGLLLFTFTLYFRPQDSIAPLAALPLSDITAFIALGALVAGRLMRRQSVIRVTPEVLAVVALGGVMVLTAPLSIWPGGAIGTFTDLYLKGVL